MTPDELTGVTTRSDTRKQITRVRQQSKSIWASATGVYWLGPG